MTTTVVYMIGQAHLEPVWLQRWTEVLATGRSAVNQLAEYPDLRLNPLSVITAVASLTPAPPR